MILEPEDVPEDIYKFSPVKENDPIKNPDKERGSCSTYHNRVDVTDHVSSLSLEEAEQQ